MKQQVTGLFDNPGNCEVLDTILVNQVEVHLISISEELSF